MEKYKLPPSHVLFQNQSIAELNMEMYEDLYVRKADIESDLDKDVTDKQPLLEQLAALNTALGEEAAVVDPLADKWERELAAGRIPDLDEEM